MTRHSLPLLAATLLVSACTVGPDYERPTAPVSAKFKEDAGWKVSQPREDIDRGAWWSVYHDPLLDQLERQVSVSNQTLAADEAAFRSAQALVAQARAGWFPTVNGSASVRRGNSGGGSSSSTTSSASSTSTTTTAATSSSFSGGSSVHTSYSPGLSASWEIDVWGQIRRQVEEDVASAQASAGTLASARLSAQATLATDYFELCAQDELKRLLDAAAEAYRVSLRITENQYRSGTAAKADVMTARTQLETTLASAINAGLLRAQYEHAIAVLIGKAPGDFSIPSHAFAQDVPVVPVSMPSTLLERRPDIAAAERNMAATNAAIGVAIASYYPTISLTGSLSYAGNTFGSVFKAANQVWAIGSSASMALFDGGLRNGEVDQARANFDQSVATYRQTTLTAFQQVEDELSALRILAEQADAQAVAVADAKEAELLELNQYKAGTVAYTAVVTAQQTSLSNQETALSVQQQRLVASVTLIEALGGGWTADDLPTRDQIVDGDPAPGTPAAAHKTD
jgi:NodT family efflux transporter outer membrane factor (OMF) lipoprotein